MNPAFIILVIIFAILIWLLCAFLYVPIGRLFNKLFKDSHNAMNSGGEIDFMNMEDKENE